MAVHRRTLRSKGKLIEITDTGGGKKRLQIANAINNTGDVAGLLTLGKPVSEQHGFLLVPKSP